GASLYNQEAAVRRLLFDDRAFERSARLSGRLAGLGLHLLNGGKRNLLFALALVVDHAVEENLGLDILDQPDLLGDGNGEGAGESAARHDDERRLGFGCLAFESDIERLALHLREALNIRLREDHFAVVPGLHTGWRRGARTAAGFRAGLCRL